MLLFDSLQQTHRFLTASAVGIFASATCRCGQGTLQMVGGLGIFALVGEQIGVVGGQITVVNILLGSWTYRNVIAWDPVAC